LHIEGGGIEFIYDANKHYVWIYVEMLISNVCLELIGKFTESFNYLTGAHIQILQVSCIIIQY